MCSFQKNVRIQRILTSVMTDYIIQNGKAPVHHAHVVQEIRNTSHFKINEVTYQEP